VTALSSPSASPSVARVTRLSDAPSAVEHALAVVADREPVIRAWVVIDAEGARADARRAVDGVLGGLTLGVKDIFDTADLPTEYGSPIYAGFQPRADAASVALLRGAGATLMGKTVTTEFAWSAPAATTNPHRSTHTPGGSSSGSAAAVAAGMVDLAIGTQTAGSVIRPASFCGVFALKPTFGLIPTAGMKPAAPSLDTVGIFAADLDVLDLARAVLTRRSPALRDRAVSFALVRTEQWLAADPDCRRVVESTAELVRAKDRDLPVALLGLADDAPIVQSFEGAASLAWERRHHSDLLSEELRSRLDWGDGLLPAEYDDVVRRATYGRSRDVIDELFADADVLITPAATGEAPEGLGFTGDPRFCRLWTLLGLPALNVPGNVGTTGLPIGVQLIARPRHEDDLIRAAHELATKLQ
jgi:Asp-tRNA(Asn)/Glu-tRNA(Gln) amidotransferase A subunit family amidase